MTKVSESSRNDGRSSWSRWLVRLLVTALGALVIGIPAVASAAPASSDFTVTPLVSQIGGTVVFSGGGCAPDPNALFGFDGVALLFSGAGTTSGQSSAAAAFNANADGTYSVDVLLRANTQPPLQPGPYQAVVDCNEDSSGVYHTQLLGPVVTIAGVTQTTTTLRSSLNPSLTGQQVTYTATVTPTPDGGIVAFSDWGTVIAGCAAQALSAGTATCTQTYSSPGTHMIAAVYFGDTNFNTSTSDGLLSQTVTASPGGMVPLTPARVLDTRSANGAVGPVAAGATVHLNVQGRGGVPATAGTVGAVVLNVTVTQPAQGGYITVYPHGVNRPTTSNLNFSKGQTVPNLVIAPVGPDGQVDFYNGSAGTVQLIADVSGYFAAGVPSVAGTLGTVTPARVLDTRSANGAVGPVAAGATVHLNVQGRGGVPATAGTVGAVVLNVTVTQPAQGGYITVYPHGVNRPTTSNLNFSKGQTVPNLVIAPVGPDGQVDFYNGSAGTVQLIADVSGYFAAGVPSVAGTLGTVTPARVLDTRSANGAVGPVAAGATVHLNVQGRGGVPATAGTVGAVVLNVTVTQPAQGGYITVYPHGVNRPTTSNLNFSKGQTVPNLVIAPVGPDGQVDFYNGSAGTVHLIADTSGWFANP